MHHQFGSVLEGLIHQRGLDPSIRKVFYSRVYSDTNMMRLKTYSQPRHDSSGYSLQHNVLRSLFKFKDHSIILASNSPRFHVERVLRRLGLSTLPVEGVLTPGNPSVRIIQSSEYFRTTKWTHQEPACVLGTSFIKVSFGDA